MYNQFEHFLEIKLRFDFQIYKIPSKSINLPSLFSYGTFLL